MASVIDPWSSGLPESYEKIVRTFGLEEYAHQFPDENRLMRRGVVFAGRDLGVIAKCIAQKKPYYVLSGLMPTNDTIHFGNKIVIENIKYFQDHGAVATYVLIADLEASVTRGVSLEEAQRRALTFHIPAFIALGLDPKKTVFYFQSQNMKVVHLAYEFAKKVTLNEFRAIYGTAEPGRMMAAVAQAGDMLFPQLMEKQTIPGIIPVGVDQDPHLRLARDIMKRFKDKYQFAPLASIYHKFTPARDGSEKMSKSKPESNIDIPDDLAAIKKKILRAMSGGRDTLEEHRKKGGIPENDVSFVLLAQHLIEDDAELQKISDAYKKGTMTSSELKEITIARMTAFMTDFLVKFKKAQKQVKHLHFLKL